MVPTAFAVNNEKKENALVHKQAATHFRTQLRLPKKVVFICFTEATPLLYLLTIYA